MYVKFFDMGARKCCKSSLCVMQCMSSIRYIFHMAKCSHKQKLLISKVKVVLFKKKTSPKTIQTKQTK